MSLCAQCSSLIQLDTEANEIYSFRILQTCHKTLGLSPLGFSVIFRILKPVDPLASTSNLYIERQLHSTSLVEIGNVNSLIHIHILCGKDRQITQTEINEACCIPKSAIFIRLLSPMRFLSLVFISFICEKLTEAVANRC